MRKVIISATALTAFALLASASANALDNWGPKQVGNQCFKVSTNVGRDSSFGTWGACPQTASVAVAPARHKMRQRAKHSE